MRKVAQRMSVKGSANQGKRWVILTQGKGRSNGLCTILPRWLTCGLIGKLTYYHSLQDYMAAGKTGKTIGLAQASLKVLSSVSRPQSSPVVLSLQAPVLVGTDDG